ncbi:hypothetical protein H8A99_19135 [Bradyrhizobium sp. Arg68]|uniref:hypothetical protein n=1 Tax=Bradyrhizobium ivorense TaxID=2511166 RepID=UPI001E3535D0|nr:hypothetical protein [Bradyrhizobium ivorense]MCC8938528.1 hypothetical protein [Bradyrhizobium ivorense]
MTELIIFRAALIAHATNFQFMCSSYPSEAQLAVFNSRNVERYGRCGCGRGCPLSCSATA